MKRYLLVVLFLISVFNLQAQDITDTIRIARQNSKFQFYQGKKEYSFLELSGLIKSNPEAYDYYKNARLERTFSGLLFGLGFITTCFGILYGVSEGVEQEEPSMVWSGLIVGVVIGGGIMALSIPIEKAYKKNIRKSIDLYNHGLPYSELNRLQIRAGLTENGISLRLNF